MKLSKIFNLLFGKKDIFKFEIGDFQCRIVVRGQAPTNLNELERDLIKDALAEGLKAVTKSRIEEKKVEESPSPSGTPG